MNSRPAISHPLAIVFETHATSLDNEAGLASGQFDVDLSSAGERQARELGARHAPDLVVTSDLKRAWRTAEIAFGDRRPIRRDARLRECDYGAMTRHPVRDLDRVRLDHVAAPFPGGESYEQVAARVAGLLRELRSGAAERILIVGHRATFYALEHLLRGRALVDVVGAEWTWQPGWSYDASR
jgi:broad specificity phosphatase PhoE